MWVHYRQLSFSENTPQGKQEKQKRRWEKQRDFASGPVRARCHIRERKSEPFLMCTNLHTVAQQPLTKCGLNPKPLGDLRVEIAISIQHLRATEAPFGAAILNKVVLQDHDPRTWHFFTIPTHQIQPLKASFIGWQVEWGVKWGDMPSRTEKVHSYQVCMSACKMVYKCHTNKRNCGWVVLASIHTLFSFYVATRACGLVSISSVPIFNFWGLSESSSFPQKVGHVSSLDVIMHFHRKRLFVLKLQPSTRFTY